MNGADTTIWEDNWLPRESKMRPFACLAPNPLTHVHELLDMTTASWRTDLLEALFLPIDLQIIMGIPLSTKNVEDRWEWGFEKKGVFYVKSAYIILVSTKARRENWLMAGRLTLIWMQKQKHGKWYGGAQFQGRFTVLFGAWQSFLF